MAVIPELEPVGPALPGSTAEAVGGLKRRVVRGGALLIVTRSCTQVFVWASTLLIARFLSPLDYGLMSIGLLLVGLADLFAEAGMGRALIQKEPLQPRDIDEGFTLHVLLAAAMYGLLFFAAEPLAVFVFDAPQLPGFLRVLGIHVLLAPFMGVPLALLDRDLRMGKQSAIHAGTAVLQSGLVLILAVLGFGYWSLVAGSLARRVVEVIFYTATSGWRPRFSALSSRVKRLLTFGVHLSLGTFLWYLYSNVDYAFVGNFSGPVVLGFYALAFQLTSLPAEKLTANINKIAYPAFCRLQSDRRRLHDWFVRLLVLVGFLGMPVMVGMALVAADGLTVMLGAKWRDAVLPFQLLSGAGLIKIYSAMFPVLWTALGRPDLNLKFNLACAVVFPVGFYAAGSLWGMPGVCLVWMLLYPLVALAGIYATRAVTGIGPRELVLSQTTIFGATAIMAWFVLLVQWAMADTREGLRLVLAISTGVLAYAASMLALGRRTVLADVRALWRELKGS